MSGPADWQEMVLDTFINANVQWWFQDSYAPVNGYYAPPAGPGFGYELDERKILRRTELA